MYYDTKDSVSNDEANVIENKDVTFGSKLFTLKQNPTRNYYSIGEPLHALFTVGGQTSVGNLPLPKPNLSGL